MLHYKSTSEDETIAIAQEYAKTIQAGDIIAFYGDLGAGKSLFCRELIRTLCHDPELHVPSPTFTLVQTYDSDIAEIWHFDMYRINDPDEIYELGWEEALAGNITLIEWPERIASLLPKKIKKVEFSAISDNFRDINISEP